MISILIPVKNEGKFIRQCLDGIYSQKIDEEFEVIIIDSGSTDDTVNIIKEYDVQLHHINPSSYHHSKTRNLLVQKAKGDIFVFTVGDAIPYNNFWLKELVSPLKENAVAASYSRQIPREESNPVDSHFIKNAFPPYKIEKKLGNLMEYDYALHWDDLIFFSDVSSAYRKEIWEKFKFDENLRYGEDQAIAKKILEDGYTIVYNPSSIIIHSHEENSKTIFKRNIEIARAFREISGAKARLITLPFNLIVGSKNFYSVLKKMNINRKLYWTYTSFKKGLAGGLGRFIGFHYNKIPSIFKNKFKFLPEEKRNINNE